MMQLVNTILIGVTSGAIYSLMALSIVIIWRSSRVINFAQAGLALLSTYIGYECVKLIGNYWLALPIAVLAGAIAASLIEVLFMRFLSKLHSNTPISAVAPIIVTLGLLGIIRASIAFIWGGQELRIAAPLSNVGYSVGDKTLVFSPMKLMIIITVILVLITLGLVFQRTNLGLALKASSFAPEISRLAGVRVDLIRNIGWAISGSVAALAGLLQTANGSGSISPEALEFAVLLVSGFIAAVIGGLESLIGAVLGGLFLGTVVSFALMYIDGGLFFIAPLFILIIVLIVRPRGLFAPSSGRHA